MAWIETIVHNPIVITLIFLIILLVLTLKFLSYHTAKCWSGSNVRVADAPSIVWPLLRKKHLGIHEQLMIKTYGRVFGVTQFGQPVLYCAEPDLIGAVLSKDFTTFVNRRNVGFGSDELFSNFLFTVTDDKWKRLRAIISPTFTTGKLRKMQPLIDDCLQKLVSDFNGLIAENNEIDMKTPFGAFTMNVICQVAFGTKVDALDDTDNPIIVNARQLISPNISVLDVINFAIVFTLPKVADFLRLTLFPIKCMQFFREFTLKIIDERRNGKSDGKRYDFLQLLFDALENSDESDRTENTDIEDKEVIDDEITFVTHNKTLTDTEMIAQCVMFFMAGYETTSTTLSYATYLLACNPDVQQRVYEEANSAFESSTQIDIDKLRSLTYIDAVISETLRLYPPAMFTERLASRDYKYGSAGDGIRLKKGTLVHIPIYSLHRDPKFFPEPNSFKPDRFLAENCSHHSYAYLPFGGGPRNCVARRFALMEAKLALLYSVYNFHFSTNEQTKHPPACTTNNGLLVPININLEVYKR